MKNTFLGLLFCGCLAAFLNINSARAAELYRDTSDPLYLLVQEDFLSETGISYWDSTLRIEQAFSYGLNNRLSIGASVHYQFDFDGTEDGFSSIDLGGIYRLANASSNTSHIIYDVLLGLKVGGSSHVRTPYYADSTYYAGLRFGRQWAGMTLAGTVKSSWIFDDVRGMAYIDFIPEAYFRVAQDWRLGGGFMFRKATDPQYNQEWINFKIVSQFGRTQYLFHFDYEFESSDFQVGANVKILF